MRRVHLNILRLILLWAIGIVWRTEAFLPRTAKLTSRDELVRMHLVPKGSAVSFRDPETSCEVVLLGCFHGSQSSAADVERALSKPTDVVVLELCASRFADLRRHMSTPVEETQNQSFVSQWVELVQETVQRRGWTTGGVAAVLTGFTGLQTMLSGLEPGLEFTTSVECALKQQSDIILADQNVDETLEKMGKLPLVSLDLVKDFVTKGLEASYAPEAKALSTALLGSDRVPGSVNLFKFLTRSQEALLDMARLILPPFILLQSFIIASHHVMGTIVTNEELTSPTIFLSDESRALLWVLANALSLTTSFALIALPAVKVVLRERDEFLAKGIRAACREAGPNGRVVAVLGLLHVNGVAERLLEQVETPITVPNKA